MVLTAAGVAAPFDGAVITFEDPHQQVIGPGVIVAIAGGLVKQQLALALEGREREDVLAQIVELLAQRELAAESDGGAAS